jgi:hypothetical protein
MGAAAYCRACRAPISGSSATRARSGALIAPLISGHSPHVEQRDDTLGLRLASAGGAYSLDWPLLLPPAHLGPRPESAPTGGHPRRARGSPTN